MQACQAWIQRPLKKAAEEAKEKCPISNLLRPGLENLTLDAKLSG